ncbi:hypothetical protein BDD12DRAFT_14775 [Trichophaea hybrida]|nr:hypothetical protein BDD12DRAFT_14775 [Trichophaea hybrida]
MLSDQAIGPRLASKQAFIAARDPACGENSLAIGSSHRAKVSKQASIAARDPVCGRTHGLSDQAIGPRLASKQASIAARDPACGENSRTIGSSHPAKVSKQACIAARDPSYGENSRAIG